MKRKLEIITLDSSDEDEEFSPSVSAFETISIFPVDAQSSVKLEEDISTPTSNRTLGTSLPIATVVPRELATDFPNSGRMNESSNVLMVKPHLTEPLQPHTSIEKQAEQPTDSNRIDLASEAHISVEAGKSHNCLQFIWCTLSLYCVLVCLEFHESKEHIHIGKYAEDVRDLLKVGMRVRCIGGDLQLEVGDTGTVVAIDNGGIRDLNVEVCNCHYFWRFCTRFYGLFF